MVDSASGSRHDKEKNSYVVSPTRAEQTAQEVYLESSKIDNAQMVELLTLQNQILKELKVMNLHLSIITGEDICL